MRFKNLARHPDIGANSYLLEFGETKIVLDAGTHPKHTGTATTPLFEKIEPHTVDAAIISHPHLDHIGGLPVLLRGQPDAAVIMTELTLECGSALLHNSVNVMKSQRDELNVSEYPLYTHKEVDRLEPDWLVREPQKSFWIGDEDRVECEFFRAGHVQGAVGVKMEFEGKTVFYTGDAHFENQTLTKAADFPREKVDTLILETTRGDSPRGIDYTRGSEKKKMGRVIRETLQRGGAVLIPVFAFGKTQETLLMLRELQDAGEIPQVPVHIGGLSTKMTNIADRHSDDPGRLHRGYRILADFPELKVLKRGHKEPEFHPGQIYALSSGMMSEKTVSNRFARKILASPKHSLIFVGYADESTPGGRIVDAGQGGTVELDGKSGHEFDIECEVHKFDFSGHAPREQLVDYAVACDPEQIILVHGDPNAKSWFHGELRKQLPNTKIVIPRPGQELEL